MVTNTMKGILVLALGFWNLTQQAPKEHRWVKGKPFHKPNVSTTIQEVLKKAKSKDNDRFVFDDDANIGMALLIAYTMGFHVLTFKPIA